MVERAAIIGGGVIGAGWVARLIENSVPVTIYDPSENAKDRLQIVLDNAERAYSRLTMAARPSKGAITWTNSAAEAASKADLIVEAVPERLELKREVYAEIETTARPDAIIASSTSGILPSELQAEMTRPERLIVAHPFNPVYLLPLVEIVAGEKTGPTAVKHASEFYASIGMKPLIVRKEIEAFIADRLLEAVWRESLWLVKDGICTTEELDDAIRMGFGLRWAQMGLFETYRLAGGDAGMRHFLQQFGPALKWPWSKLTDVPELDDELIELISGHSDTQSGHLSIHELERIRDDNLVGIMQSLKQNDWGAGKVLAAYEQKLFDAGAHKGDGLELSQPIRTMERHIPPDWTDYNNHMTEARYLQCFGDANDAFMRLVGADADYIASGLSFFTVETHIRHLNEVRSMEPVYTTTQLLEGRGKRMRLFHHLHHGDGTLLATGEHMMIHVSLETRAACDPAPQVAAKIAEIAKFHAALPMPEGAGRAVGQPR